MYSKVFEGEKIRIRNDHMAKLLERFNRNNFKAGVSNRIVVNHTPCALCVSCKDKMYKLDCSGCPLDVFVGNHSLGCVYIINQLIPNRRIHIYWHVAYLPSNERDALGDLEAITDFLKSFKKE